MEPKPLFPNYVTSKAQTSKTQNNGPKPLFSSEVQTKPSGPKPAFSKQSDTVSSNPLANVGKVLFPDQAVNPYVVDPFYSSHPLCANLSTKDISRVRSIVITADVEDAEFVIHYGDEQRDRFTKLINDILAEQTSGQTGSVNLKIRSLLGCLDKSNALVRLIRNPPPKPSLFARLRTTENKVLQVTDVRYHIRTAISQVDALVTDLQKTIAGLVTLINSFDTVFSNNQDNFMLLRLHVIAGRILTEKYQDEIIPERERNADPTDLFASHNLSYFKDSVDRFKAKVDDLDALAHAVLLNAPAIRTLQMATKNKAENIQRIAQILVPTWKQECAALLAILDSTTAEDIRQLQDDTYFRRENTVLASLEHSVAEVKFVLTQS